MENQILKLMIALLLCSGAPTQGSGLCPQSLQAADEFSWQNVVDRDGFETGGLGKLIEEDFLVWACFHHHCSPVDLPCWKYNERRESWQFWGLNSEVQLLDQTGDLDEHSDSSELKHIAGTIATIWTMPSGLRRSKCCSADRAGDLGNNSWWRHSEDWKIYEARRVSDATRMKYILGQDDRVSAIIYFPAYLADPVFQGLHTYRLNEVVEDFHQNGITPILLVGRPDYKVDPSNVYDTLAHDPIHNIEAFQYLKNRTLEILSLPSVQARVRHVSVYWVGLSWFCQTQGSGVFGCSEDEIMNFNMNLQLLIEGHRESLLGYQHLLHLDGPIWEGCWPQPCSSWNYSGYTPRSMSGMSGILAESWVQGSLPGAVKKLLDEGVTDTNSLLLISDVPNCDLYSDKPCAIQSRNPATDVAQWFAWLRGNNLGDTWATWNHIDGGIEDRNEYGDAWQNSTTDVTVKGSLYREYALGNL